MFNFGPTVTWRIAEWPPELAAFYKRLAEERR